MMLYPLPLSRLQSVEAGQFIVRLLTDIANQGHVVATDVEINALHGSLVVQSPIYNAAMMQITARAESILLLQLDEVRDHKVSALNRGLSIHEYTDDAVELAQYHLVRIVLDTYKDVERMNFEAESLAIANLCADLRDAEHLPATTALGLVTLVNKLETANNEFKAVFDARSTAIIDTTVYDAKTLRKNILNTYKDLAEYVLIMAKRKNTAYYKDILATINVGRHYYANILAIRNGHAHAKPNPTP